MSRPSCETSRRVGIGKETGDASKEASQAIRPGEDPASGSPEASRGPQGCRASTWREGMIMRRKRRMSLRTMRKRYGHSFASKVKSIGAQIHDLARKHPV